MHGVLVVIFVFIAILFAIIYACKKAKIVKGGSREAAFARTKLIKCDLIEKDLTAAMKRIRELIEEHSFINIVTVNAPIISMARAYHPAVFVQPDVHSCLPKEDENPVEYKDCLFVVIESEMFVRHINSELNNKVKYYHIDYGMSGNIYNTHDDIMIVKNWLRDDGYIVLSVASSLEYLRFGFIPNSREIVDADSMSKHLQSNYLGIDFELIIPDNQHMTGEGVYALDFINHPLTMNEYQNGEIKPYYIHNITYVFYMIEHSIHDRFGLTRAQALKRWGLDEQTYQMLLNIRRNPTECEIIAYITDLSKYDVKAITYACNEYFFSPGLLSEEYVETTLAKVNRILVNFDYDDSEEELFELYRSITNIYDPNEMVANVQAGRFRWVNITFYDLVFYMLRAHDKCTDMFNVPVLSKDQILSTLLGVSIDEYHLMRDTDVSLIKPFNAALTFLKPIRS